MGAKIIIKKLYIHKIIYTQLKTRIHQLNSSTIDELGSWCLEGLVEPGNSSGRGKEVSIVTLQAATAQTSPEGA